MQAKLYIYFYLLLAMFYSCDKRTEQSYATLIKAEQLITQYPDSAFRMLQGIVDSNKMTEADYSLWCLLYTQAANKCRIPAETDSLIVQAKYYFAKTDQKHRQAQCYFYAGQVYTDLKQMDVAASNYLQAIDILVDTDDNKLLGLAYNNLGFVYKSVQEYEKALAMFQLSLLNFESVADSINITFALRDVAKSWSKIGNRDSAEFYYQKTLLSLCTKADSLQKYGIYHSISAYYKLEERYDSSLYYIRRALSYGQNTNFRYTSYLIMGRIYQQIAKPDSAIFYFRQAQESPVLRTKAGAIEEQIRYCQSVNDVIGENRLLTILLDAKQQIGELYQVSKIKEAELRYSKERTLRESEQLSAKHTQTMLVLIIVICLLGLIILIILYSYKCQQEKQRNKQKVLELEYKQLNQEIKSRDDAIGQNLIEIKRLEKSLISLENISNHCKEESDERLELKSVIEGLKHEINSLTKENEQLNHKNQEYLSYRKIIRQKNESLISMFVRESKLMTLISKYDGTPIQSDLIELEVIKEIKKLDPGFISNLRKLAPTLNEKEKLLCLLIRLNIENIDIARLLSISSRSVSRYKSTIVKARFKKDSILLDDLIYAI